MLLLLIRAYEMNVGRLDPHVMSVGVEYQIRMRNARVLTWYSQNHPDLANWLVLGGDLRIRAGQVILVTVLENRVPQRIIRCSINVQDPYLPTWEGVIEFQLGYHEFRVEGDLVGLQ